MFSGKQLFRKSQPSSSTGKSPASSAQPPSGQPPVSTPGNGTTPARKNTVPTSDHNVDDSPRLVDIEKTKNSLADAEKLMKKMKEDRSKARKMASQYVKILLQPVSNVCTLLDGLASTYPPAGIVSKTLATVIKLEMDRRENDARILVIYQKFASALLSLSQLQSHFKPDPEYQQQLNEELKNVEETVLDFANFSDTYYKRKIALIYHLVHSNSEKEKLLDYATKIDTHKTELTALVIRQTSKDASVTRITATKTASNVDLLVKYFIVEPIDDKERQAQEFLDSHGGEGAVQNNPELLSQFAKQFHQQMSDGLKKAAQESVDDAMINNRGLFELRFETVKDQLKESIEISRDMILAEINEGAYTRIENEEIKTKSANIKRRQFIAALADHYNLLFKTHYLDHHTEHPDAWTLHFLTKVAYHPAIGDAMDEDGSGYISVSEINKFLSHKGNMSIPVWFAYWAHGWLDEISESSKDIGFKIFQIKKIKEEWKLKIREAWLREIGEDITDSEAEEIIQPYFYQVEKISQLDAAQPRQLPEPQKGTLDSLRRERRKELEKTMGRKLSSTLKYTIADSTSIDVLIGNQPIESMLMILLPLLLLNHLKVFQEAKSNPFLLLVTIYDMQCSLAVINERVGERIEELRDAWRQNRLDLDYQFQHFGGGLFESAWAEIKKAGSTEVDFEQYLYLTMAGLGEGYSDDEEDTETVSKNPDFTSQERSSPVVSRQVGNQAAPDARQPYQSRASYGQPADYSRGQPTASREMGSQSVARQTYHPETAQYGAVGGTPVDARQQPAAREVDTRSAAVRRQQSQPQEEDDEQDGEQGEQGPNDEYDNDEYKYNGNDDHDGEQDPEDEDQPSYENEMGESDNNQDEDDEED